MSNRAGGTLTRNNGLVVAGAVLDRRTVTLPANASLGLAVDLSAAFSSIVEVMGLRVFITADGRALDVPYPIAESSGSDLFSAGKFLIRFHVPPVHAHTASSTAPGVTTNPDVVAADGVSTLSVNSGNACVVGCTVAEHPLTSAVARALNGVAEVAAVLTVAAPTITVNNSGNFSGFGQVAASFNLSTLSAAFVVLGVPV